MKKLKKALFLAILLTFSYQSFAQMKFGLLIGTNFSNQIMKDSDTTYSEDNKMLPGGHLGFTLGFPVSDAFSIETGLLLNTKGHKIKETQSGVEHIEYHYFGYLDIPVNARYEFDLGGPKFYLAVGPYFALGLFGKGFSKTTTGNVESTAEIDYELGSEETDDMKRLDIGLNFGGGFQFGGFIVGATYGVGLKNLSPITDNGYKLKNRVLSISIGARF